jgi:protein transport protein SEC61 subunit gamma-like protein
MASIIEINPDDFRIPGPKEWPGIITKKMREYKRVLSITRKPKMNEFQAVVKVTGLGMTVIGLIGFTIFVIVQLIKKLA